MNDNMNENMNMLKEMEKMKIAFLVDFKNQIFSNDKNYVKQKELINSKKDSFNKMLKEMRRI